MPAAVPTESTADVSPEAFLRALSENKVRITAHKIPGSREYGSQATDDILLSAGLKLQTAMQDGLNRQYQVDFTPIVNASQRARVIASFCAAIDMPNFVSAASLDLRPQLTTDGGGMKKLLDRAAEHAEQFPEVSAALKDIISAKVRK